MEEKKRKQHYVFQAYLKSWEVDKKIWCSRDWNKPFSGSTERIANIRDFYRLKPLNSDEERFYRLLIHAYSTEVQKALLQHLSAYLAPTKWSQQLDILKQFAVLKYGDAIPDELQAEITRLEKYVDVSINNIEENYLSEIEGESTKWLESLKKKNADFYYSFDTSEKEDDSFDDEMFHFLYFLCVQMFRTNATKERWISGFLPSLDNPQLSNLNVSKDRINLENLAPHFLWEIQNLLAYSLRKNKAHLTILINETNIPFVTTDQPVINLKADYSKLNSETKELILYYPISPEIAITVNDSNTQNTMLLSEEEVHFYNIAMAKAAYHEVFANSEDLILHLKGIVVSK